MEEEIMEEKHIHELSIYPYDDGESPNTYLKMYKLGEHISKVKAKIEKNLTDDTKKYLGDYYINKINERYKSLLNDYDKTLNPVENLYNGPYKKYSPKMRIILLRHDNVKEELSIKMTKKTQDYPEMQKKEAERIYLKNTGFSGKKTRTSRRSPTSRRYPNKRSSSRSPKANSLLSTFTRTFGRIKPIGFIPSASSSLTKHISPQRGNQVVTADTVFVKQVHTKSQAGGKNKKKYTKTKPKTKPKTKSKSKPKTKSKSKK